MLRPKTGEESEERNHNACLCFQRVFKHAAQGEHNPSPHRIPVRWSTLAPPLTDPKPKDKPWTSG